MTSHRPVGVAVVGAGYWGTNLVRNIQATPGLHLQALYDLDTDRACRVLGPYSTVAVFGSLEQVLAAPEVEAVAVATPAATHYDVVMASLQAGKHVLVEKPLAPSLAEGRALVAAAEQRGVVLMLGHTYCYTPAVRHLRHLVRGGEIGELQYLDSVRINLGLAQPDVDVLWDLAPHDLSIFDSILPADVTPVAVSAHGSDPIGAGRACVAHLTIQLSTGAMAHVHVNWLSPTKIRTFVVGGSRRTVVWDDLNPSLRLAVYDRGVERSVVGQAGVPQREQAMVSYRIGDMVAPALPEREALREVMAEFAAAIIERRVALTDGRAGLRVLALLESAGASMSEGGAFVPVLDAEAPAELTRAVFDRVPA